MQIKVQFCDKDTIKLHAKYCVKRYRSYSFFHTKILLRNTDCTFGMISLSELIQTFCARMQTFLYFYGNDCCVFLPKKIQFRSIGISPIIQRYLPCSQRLRYIILRNCSHERVVYGSWRQKQGRRHTGLHRQQPNVTHV